MKKVNYILIDTKIEDIKPSNIPLQARIRFLLNAAGFKFKDDGKFSSILNENPEPIGIFKSWRDEMLFCTHYEQEYEDE